MAVNLQQLQADDDAYAQSVKQSPPGQAQAPQTHADVLDSIQNETGAAKKVGLFQQFGNVAGRVTTNVLDSVVSAADSMFDNEPMKKARDVVAGGLTAAANTGDAAMSAMENGPGKPFVQMAGGSGTPNAIWGHAKGALMDFRDAVAVQDPTLADNLVQGVGQLALPFAGYSRALGGVHTLAETLGAGMVTDATALAPHDARLADLFSLGKQTEGKFGDVLRTLSPDGSALNAYANYLGDRGDESEAEGRFKNVLDGFGGNLIATPLLHAVGMVLKQGTAGLRYAMENGVGSAGDLMPANQEGKIGWHGTPHDFNTDVGFDDSKFGTGEGANVYGVGHYLAEVPGVAETYQKGLSRRNVTPGSPLDAAQTAVDAAGGDKQKAFQALTKRANSHPDPEVRDQAQAAARLIKSGNTDQGRGSLIEAHVPDAHVENMLDWDKPLTEQKLPQKVIDEIQELRSGGNEGIAHVLSDPEATGADLHMVLQHVMGPTGASKFLDEAGVPGIKYLDGNSRSVGNGTRNLVVFKGKNIAVIKKNGAPVGVEAAPKTNMSLSKEERALERERVAALRDKEEGVEREFTPEPIPRNAAEREGATARRRKED